MDPERSRLTRHDHPPLPWEPARRLARQARRAFAPIEHFLAIEAASGILLMAAATIALVWANSPWRASYEALWHTPIGFCIGAFRFERDLHFWINDGLMTIFFFVVGLEIRREIHHGSLSDLRRAALPLVAALGGMLVPAAIYAALNHGRPSAHGWGIPMATDIAFAVGVMSLLGKRAPPALRILLLALAVMDDVGAILVIAVFYSAGLEAAGFAVLGAGLALTLGMQAVGVRNPWVYVLPAGVMWIGAFLAGIHPTLAGVITGLLTPARVWFGANRILERAAVSLAALRARTPADDREVLSHLDVIAQARREAISPLERILHALHGWVAFGIMPLFALANAGVPLGEADLGGDGLWVFAGVGLGLVVGKPLGVIGLSWLAVRLRVATLPAGLSWLHIGLMGAVAGIGFTMALFIANLALPAGALLETAKLGILTASGLVVIAVCILGRLLLPHPG
jgi:NhaA family Na+:H+ antiporter